MTLGSYADEDDDVEEDNIVKGRSGWVKEEEKWRTRMDDGMKEWTGRVPWSLLVYFQQEAVEEKINSHNVLTLFVYEERVTVKSTSRIQRKWRNAIHKVCDFFYWMHLFGCKGINQTIFFSWTEGGGGGGHNFKSAFANLISTFLVI